MGKGQRLIGVLTLFGYLLVAGISNASASDRLTALQPDERAAWSAVGMITSEGRDGAVQCSGVLVAPDLVITAAHCTTKNTGLMDRLQFTAGLDGSRLAASSGVVKIIRHPAWDYATGKNKLRLDLAALRLGRLIPNEKVPPAKLRAASQPLAQSGALFGYQKSADSSLHGRFGCTLTQGPLPDVITSDCKVTDGNSGGAVMVREDGEWRLAGITVARQNPGDAAISLEVNTWLQDLVSAAEARAAQRAKATR